MLLVDFLLYVTPGGAGIFFLMRWVKGKTVVSGLRVDAVRADAELGASREAARVAQGTAREQRVLLGDALQVAKTVERVDETLTWVAGFLTDQVQWRPGDGCALPGALGQPSITAGDQEEGGRP
jgi:hypothetical protein